ncbi:MAG: type II toxin-antitoxin system RelE/ParE family toxin [Acidobacteria bacterium]|nr:type II toxin-antitoxin system RelE/ParE family toxin [Acidobacteriota bacterium]
MTHAFKVSRRAAGHIRSASNWWRANRPKNPEAFSTDLEAAFQLIEALPSAGEPVLHPTIPGLRRVLLGTTQHFLYYTSSPETRTVEVLALWHTSRGQGPRLT